MSVDKKPIGVYANFSEVDSLDGEEAAAYEAYLAKLQQINAEPSDDEPWILWERRLNAFYKEIVYDAFEAHGMSPPEGMELYLAGSLSKKQATKYSDLDSFVLFKNEADKEKSAPVFDAINNLFQRVFRDTRQLYPDPLGINPARFSGTVDDIVTSMHKGMIPDEEVFIMSILSSHPIFGDYVLGEELKSRLEADEEFHYVTKASYLYELAINEFSGPGPGAKISIKTHLLRPIDFMLMGLRKEFCLNSEDGSSLSADETFRILEHNHLLPRKSIDTMREVFHYAMKIRFEQHSQAGKESDNVKTESSELHSMLDKVEWLRDEMQQRKVNIIQWEESDDPALNRIDDLICRLTAQRDPVTRQGKAKCLLYANANQIGQVQKLL